MRATGRRLTTPGRLGRIVLRAEAVVSKRSSPATGTPAGRLVAVVATTVLAACGGDSTAPRFVESSLVASGRVLSAAGAPAGDAIVGIEAMNKGKSGGDYGCTGEYLVGDWVTTTDVDGRFTFKMNLQSNGGPLCVVVRAAGRGDTTWRDTASVVRGFTPVAPGAAPDTVWFDLRVR